MRTLLSLSALAASVLLMWNAAVVGQEKDAGLSDQQFSRALTMFLEDPLNDKSKDLAKALVVFTMQTPNAAVVLGEAEITWTGKKDDDRSILLFAAYLGGNTQSQLLSGVKHNDRYSGLMSLFSVYRRLQAKDKDYKIAEIDDLRKMHADGKLLAHLAELEKNMPTRLGPEEEKALEELKKK